MVKLGEEVVVCVRNVLRIWRKDRLLFMLVVVVEEGDGVEVYVSSVVKVFCIREWRRVVILLLLFNGRLGFLFLEGVFVGDNWRVVEICLVICIVILIRLS